MTFARDEVRVLRDAYLMHRNGTDYSETEAWETPVVDRLVADGVLEVSVVGRILGARSFRPTQAGMARAAECYRVFEGDLSVTRIGIASALDGAA